MDTDFTCGKGLAQRAALPERIATLLEGTATVLETHLTSLSRNDPEAQPEIDAYTEVASRHREHAAGLSALASRMAGFEELPMPEHDLAVLTSPAAMQPFERLVRQEEALLELLRNLVEEDRAMLRAFDGG